MKKGDTMIGECPKCGNNMSQCGCNKTISSKCKLTKITKLWRLKNDGIIVSHIDPISEKKEFILICQKCGKKWKIKNPKKLPKTCIKCKRDPFTGPGKRGRPKK